MPGVLERADIHGDDAAGVQGVYARHLGKASGAVQGPPWDQGVYAWQETLQGEQSGLVESGVISGVLFLSFFLVCWFFFLSFVGLAKYGVCNGRWDRVGLDWIGLDWNWVD